MTVKNPLVLGLDVFGVLKQGDALQIWTKDGKKSNAWILQRVGN